MPLDVEFAMPSPIEALQAWVRHNFGLSFGAEHHDTFAGRIARFCEAERLPVHDVIARLSTSKALQRRLENALSTPYTYFMREPEAFAYLAAEVLAPLRNEVEVRLWSAAAATGDEAYSMAMVARETYGADGPLVRILATDFSEEQVAVGERGEVATGHLHELDPARRARWFLPSAVPDRMSVVPELRALCTFRRLNLATAPWPFSQQFHAILLRNVLYYFDDVTMASVLRAAVDHLVPGGALITSVTEPIESVPDGLTRIASGIYRKESTA